MKTRPVSYGFKVCPFCGSLNIMMVEVQEKHKVECQVCGCQTAAQDEPLEALMRWNRRSGTK